MKLSIAMITLNEEQKLERTLKSIQSIADEIIIIDSGSKDKTIEIAKKYNAKIYNEDWMGFGKQKNSALEKCTGEWILMIDADEEVSGELLIEIKDIMEKDKGNVFEIPRISYCFGRKTRHKDYAIRLVKMNAGNYDSKEVHESFITTEKVYKTKGFIFHHTYISMEEYFEKFNRYTTLAAMEMRKKNKKVNIGIVMLNTFFKFIKKYFLKMAFLDGADGLIQSLYSAFYNFVKYAKLRELYIKEKKSRN